MARPDLAAFATLRRDGWVAIPGMLTRAAAVSLARRCESLLADQDDLRPGDKPAGGTLHASDLLERIPHIQATFGAAALSEAVASLLGRVVPVSGVAFRCPRPGFGRQSLHADAVANDRADDSYAVTAIVALCDFTEANGATAVVPGSHRRPDLQRRAARLDLRGDEVILTGTAGTAFVFSAHLLHRGTLNRSDRPRPALQAHWRQRPPKPVSLRAHHQRPRQP